MLCCCGFCTPTQNPEPSCLRRVSNEHTAPVAAVYMKVAPFIEHNPCCIACGKSGFNVADKRRTPLSLAATFLTLVAWALSIFSCFGVSTSSNWLRTAHWSKGRVESGVFKSGLMRRTPDGHLVGGVDVHFNDIDIFVGPSARLVVIRCPRGMHFRSVCESPLVKLGFTNLGQGKFEMLTAWVDAAAADACKLEECGMCNHGRIPSVITVAVSALTGWPMVFIDLQRSTRFGDLNCQAAMGVVIALTSMITGLASLMTFESLCIKAIPPTIYGMDAEWHLGPGVIALLVASVLKVADFIFHLILPTPHERWQKPTGDAADDILEYMKVSSATAPRTYTPLAPPSSHENEN